MLKFKYLLIYYCLSYRYQPSPCTDIPHTASDIFDHRTLAIALFLVHVVNRGQVIRNEVKVEYKEITKA